MGLGIHINKAYLVSRIPCHEAGLLCDLHRTIRIVAQERFGDVEVDFAGENVPNDPGRLNRIDVEILCQIG